ncbi:hypothetical protein B0H13DRAFT_2302616 [Mycena leptocephala]|nr:hypothetical protein B0H13DRAFT_2302616 [Mycena leptocephala]
MDPPPTTPLECTQSKCHNLVPYSGPKTPKTCEDCRESSRKSQAAGRKRKHDAKEAQEAKMRGRETSPHTERVLGVSDVSGIDATSSRDRAENPGMGSGLSDEEDSSGAIEFTDQQSLFIAIRAAFKHNKHVEFHGTCQIPEDPLITDKERVKMTTDQGHKQKARARQREGAKPRDTLGMDRCDCKSSLRVACLSGDVVGEKKLRVYLQHHDSHLPYCDHTPVEIAPNVKAQYPSVTSSQVHFAWTQMRDFEFGDEVDVLAVPPADGVEQLCWAMKKIIEPLKGQIVEIAIDATYGTNSKHLELYTVLAEHDNAGFPLSYCLLSTTGSDDLGKRKRALEAWARKLRDEYGVIPIFIHTDKDMAEIGMARDKSKLSTTPYNAQCAHAEFAFIIVTFKPPGRADPAEHEGGFLASLNTVVASAPAPDPNSVTIKIPATQPRSTMLADITNTAAPVPMDVDVEDDADADEDDSQERRTFCPVEFRQPIVDFMEAHPCAHPLIPGYSHPSPEGIRAWAVRQAYNFCLVNDLPKVWAYPWENWYRRGRWELWARAEHPEIPRLKTTMMVESHWRKIIHDYLHHFHKPRLDLLVWILVVKLAKTPF